MAEPLRSSRVVTFRLEEPRVKGQPFGALTYVTLRDGIEALPLMEQRDRVISGVNGKARPHVRVVRIVTEVTEEVL